MATDHSDTSLPPHSRRTLGFILPYILAGIIILVVIGQLVALSQTPRIIDTAMLAATGTVLYPTRPSTPTRIASPTQTASPFPTITPTSMPTTLPPPTNTPIPVPTATNTMLPLPTTAVPTETATPSITPLPPTLTPVPLTVLERIDIDNGSWGKRQIIVNYEIDASGGDQFYVTGTDGYRYRVKMGFLSSAEALAKTQEYWTFGGRGSANWGMVIQVRKQIADWYLCAATSGVCHVSWINSGQAVLFTDIYLRDAVWKSLLNDYLTGGILRPTTSTYYYEIQKAIFDPICHLTPPIPCIGFIFTRVN
jgi:hypothetical protein